MKNGDYIVPAPGMVKRACELGRKGSHSFIWQRCEHCGKERWVWLQKNRPRSLICRSCSISRINFKGGRVLDKKGYVLVRITSNHPFYGMATRGRTRHGAYVAEHRLVMAVYLNRCLLPAEKVHHKNGIKSDNRLENLELMSQSNHALKEMFCKSCALKREIRLLRWQMKELTFALQQKQELFGEMDK